MPKDEFDFEDPFELNGMAMLTHEDTTDVMAECFIEEFMRLGYNHKQVLALFCNPHYLGPNIVLEKRGYQFVRDRIAEVFARWGRAVTWRAENPLTPSLSPAEGERANRTPSNRDLADADSESGVELSEKRPLLFPPPLGGGEGQGEGARGKPSFTALSQVIESENSLTDPMGAPIPKLNV
ncbi:MAG: hypothetical protein HY298_00905 [Verrucomicrobia bacterium]|nr:hypothetical protein [Verrucomicrobiota bacterium]